MIVKLFRTLCKEQTEEVIPRAYRIHQEYYLIRGEFVPTFNRSFLGFVDIGFGWLVSLLFSKGFEFISVMKAQVIRTVYKSFNYSGLDEEDGVNNVSSLFGLLFDYLLWRMLSMFMMVFLIRVWGVLTLGLSLSTMGFHGRPLDKWKEPLGFGFITCSDDKGSYRGGNWVGFYIKIRIS